MEGEFKTDSRHRPGPLVQVKLGSLPWNWACKKTDHFPALRGHIIDALHPPPPGFGYRLRRRLTLSLRRLANGQGFPPNRETRPGALGWDVGRVAMWLRKQQLAGVAAKFQQNEIDGEALMTLEHADLLEVGITTIVQRAALLRIIGMVKKQTYFMTMTQATPICHGGTTTTSAANEDRMRRVPNAVGFWPLFLPCVQLSLSFCRLSLLL